ncbi:ABC transporter permease subunit, partial [Salmonella enterica]|uniref:ABC transporter permease subunit n=1 Tax=Salmonella enterica TaxID=28901 RepID=UPI00398C418E
RWVRVISGLRGVTVGFMAGRFLHRWTDKMICRISYVWSSLPAFWRAMLLLALFAVRWPVLPVCCAWDPGNNAGTALVSERLRHLVLPVCALRLFVLWHIGLASPATMSWVMHRSVIRFSRPRGVTGWP